MLVEAIYDNGRVIFPMPYRFAHNRFTIKIDLPDIEVVDEGMASQGKAAEMLGDDESKPFNSEYPDEYIRFKKLQDASFGKQYEYVLGKTDRELIQEYWLEKHA